MHAAATSCLTCVHDLLRYQSGLLYCGDDGSPVLAIEHCALEALPHLVVRMLKPMEAESFAYGLSLLECEADRDGRVGHCTIKRIQVPHE